MFESATTRGRSIYGRVPVVAELIQDGLELCLGRDSKRLCLLPAVGACSLPSRFTFGLGQVQPQRGAYKLGDRLMLLSSETLHLLLEGRRDRDGYRLSVGHVALILYDTLIQDSVRKGCGEGKP